MRHRLYAAFFVSFACLRPLTVAEAQESQITLGRQITVAKPGIAGAPQFIGISDAVFDDQGRVYELDALQHLLGVFDSNGRWLTGIGPSGIEKVAPFQLTGERLSLDRNNDVLVLDRQSGRIETHTLAAGRLKRINSFKLVAPSGDVCASVAEVVLIGSTAPHIVSRYTPLGKYLGSLGEPFSENEGFAVVTSQVGGMIACEPDRGIIAVATKMLPVVRAYALSGSLLWSYRIPNFRNVGTTMLPNGGYELKLNGPADVVESVFPVSSLFVVQVTRGSRRSQSRGESAIETYVLDARTGKEVSHQLNLPLIRHVRNGSALVIENDPEPVAVVYALRIGGSKP